MRQSFLLFGFLLLAACNPFGNPAVNPDPNHTHADFAVWIDGKEVDLSGQEFMSGLSTDEATHDEEDEHHHEYLHLHDGNGHVIHRHKPGLTLREFFASVGIEGYGETDIRCMRMTKNGGMEWQACDGSPATSRWYMLINGDERPFDLDYVFADTDKILLSHARSKEEVMGQWEEMTDDACLYSQTCPERGKPPAENCISDPKIPCVEPQ